MLMRFDPGVLVIIKSDGSPGNIGDLGPGMKIRAFCPAKSANASMIEIQ